MSHALIFNRSASPLGDPRVQRVIAELEAARSRPPDDDGPYQSPAQSDPQAYAEYGFSIFPEQGDLLYLLARASGARRVVEFATSLGLSTLYLAAAVRDNGGGLVIGSEIVAEKVRAARANLEAAGLSAWVDIRLGDARDTLAELGGPVDLLLLDGWPVYEGASLALQVLRLVQPQLRRGAWIVNDNGEYDYLEYVRDPRHGFLSMSLPLKAGTELSVYTGECGGQSGGRGG